MFLPSAAAALLVTVLAVAVPAGGAAAAPPDVAVIGHRGSGAMAPENTLAAIRLALRQGADYIENDIMRTKDGRLVITHDLSLARTTDVEQVFPDRTSYQVADYTLAEIKQLDAGRWFDPKFAGERIPTWQEAIEFVRATPGMGMYPELKSPPLYTGRGVDMVKLFVESVKKNGLDEPESLRTTPIILQSFDEPTVRRLAKELPGIPRVLLMGSFPQNGMTDARLREIKTFADGIAPAKELVANQPDVVKRAHAAGLTVTAYTFRASNTGPFPNVHAEMAHFLNTLGIDALFTDNPDRFPR